ncbi:hypothetical protein [Corynebacterium kefirresidentii]|uniref:hypothetical protein n=1 Tax=Corynebacterium kefirresidentii TaxID=1979527 RepID=UPI000A3A9D12|nr:hypothetical protein [Corynebacterium kefirresidentii]OUJ22357.1 hypothetical protein CBI45_09225 [Corynebacterium kefirresidentii]
MTRKKKRTHIRIIQEEFDHFTRCGISRDLTIQRLSQVYGTPVETIGDYITPARRQREERKLINA